MVFIFLWIFIIWFIFYWKSRETRKVCLQPMVVEQPRQATDWTPQPTDNMVVVSDEMNGSTIQMKVGEKRRVALSGNATTGYAWRIVKIDGGSVIPDPKWRYKPKYPLLIGSGGYFQIEFKAVKPGLADVYFIYDPVAEPRPLGYYYFLRFDVRL